jgi:hypothetical protein
MACWPLRVSIAHRPTGDLARQARLADAALTPDQEEARSRSTEDIEKVLPLEIRDRLTVELDR